MKDKNKLVNEASEIDDLEKQLKDLKEEYELFTYTISHDLKAPFRQIEGFARIILNSKSEEFDEKTNERFNLIIDAATDCQNLLNALTEFSRVEVSESTFEEFDCNDAVNSAIVRLSEDIESTSADIIVKDLPNITADKPAVERLFLELIENSIKFHKQGNKPAIEISCKACGSKNEFSIKDNGIGILEKFEDRIFTILRKGGHSNQYTGMGLGLSIAKKIATQHGGSLSLSSSSENGSVFKFVI